MVHTPKPKPEYQVNRSDTQPVPGVVVTIMSGLKIGESTLTDNSGRYLFKDVEEDELHLQVEKQHYETKEVIVHRFRPTALPGGITFNYPEDPQQNPGNILIGHAWPDEVRFIFEETFLPHDLLYINAEGAHYDSKSRAVVIDATAVNQFVFNVFAHEIAHAHQFAVYDFVSKGKTISWTDIPEGKAFIEARKRDWEEVGEAKIDSIPYFRNSATECAAEVCASYWATIAGQRQQFGNIKDEAPHRFLWAKEWLGKKYD